MSNLLDYPLGVFAVTFVTLCLAAYIADFIRKRRRTAEVEESEDFDTILTATLTLLGLITGFSFAMATSRYDQRKNYEEAEANAIGTEYTRADLLAAANTAALRELLSKYIDLRISFYRVRDRQQLSQIDRETARLQTELWSVVVHPAQTQPTPIVALAVSGMNDVLNSQGYTQAAWWNRIPPAAWGLLGLVAIFSNLLLGYRKRRMHHGILLALPMIVSFAFLLIADLDSRGAALSACCRKT
jgi:amino acid transporter